MPLRPIRRMNSSFYKRIWFISGAVILVGIIIVAKLFFLQVVQKNKYQNKADGQYVSQPGSLFSRASIFFLKNDGTRISAATMASGYKLALNTNYITDTKKLYADLAPFLSIDEQTFIDRASRKNDVYQEIATHLSNDQASTIKKLNLPGVFLYKENWRFYPGEALASQVIGFTGYKGDLYTGRYGIEQYYNKILGGTDENPKINFFAEIFSNLKNTIVKENVQQGSIVTTIDPMAQRILEEKLLAIKDTWQSEKVGGIIINPHTGEIYAMANLPSFDPNTYGDVTSPGVFANPLVENVFELGSIIKTLTMAGGIDSGVVTPDTTYIDKGKITLNKREIQNAFGRSYGKQTMQEVLNKSLNTGATFVMQQMGEESFRKYMLDFGLAEKTRVDLPNEVNNLVKNLSSDKEVDYATASFGQGIALTPISAVRAFSAIANGGTLVDPHVVKEIDYVDGTVQTTPTKEGRRVIKEDTSRTVTTMLVHLVDESLLGGTLKFKHYTGAAKTGTAQTIDPKGGYSKDQYLHTMYGYFPAYDPKFLIFLYNLKPKASEQQVSSVTLPKPLFEIADFLLTYYNVTPDR